VDIGRDGTTTTVKLEGFQVGLHARQSYYTDPEVLFLDLLMLPAAACSTFVGTSATKAESCGVLHADDVRSKQRTEEYALEDRDEAPDGKVHHP
jgi:hypothetical protein